jgi:hypothetical protein
MTVDLDKAANRTRPKRIRLSLSDLANARRPQQCLSARETAGADKTIDECRRSDAASAKTNDDMRLSVHHLA